MSAGRAVLDPVDVEDGGTELDLIPAKVAQFRRSTAVPESDHYPGSIPVPVPVRLGGLDQALDLAAVNCSRVQGRRAGALSGQLFDLYEQPPSRHEVGAPGARTGLNARRSSRAGSSLWLPRPQDGKKGPTAKSIARRVTIYPVEKNAIPHYDRFCAGTATPGIFTLTVPRTVRLTK